MRVLFSCVASYGHFFPLVPLAGAMARAGHEVAFATAESLGPQVESAGFELRPTGLSQDQRMNEFRPFREGLEAMAPDKRRSAMFVGNFAKIAAPANLAGLTRVGESWSPDVVVHETAELAAPIVAASLGLPSVHHGFGRMVPLAILAEAGELLRPLWVEAGVEPPPFAGAFRDLYVDPCPPSLQLETPPIDRVALVRPMGFDRATDDPPPAWLDRLSDRPTVYVTLGTVFNDASVFRVLLQGVEDDDLNVIVTTGPDVDPADLGHPPSNVHIERYVPQSAILARAAAVVTHGGSGSMLAALAHGVPLVLVPQGADQFDNAQACVTAGVAIRLMPADLAPATVRKAVQRVLGEKKFRTAAKRVQDEIAKMPAPASAVDAVESVVGA